MAIFFKFSGVGLFVYAVTMFTSYMPYKWNDGWVDDASLTDFRTLPETSLSEVARSSPQTRFFNNVGWRGDGYDFNRFDE